MLHRTVTGLAKITLVLIWLVLLALLVKRDVLVPTIDPQESLILTKAKETQFYGVWLYNRRIGYVVERYQQGPQGTLRVSQEASLHIRVGTQQQPIAIKLEATLSNTMALKDFSFHFSSPFSVMEATGAVQDQSLQFMLDTGQNIIKEHLPLKSPLFLPLNRRAQLLARLTNPGAKGAMSFFDPISLSTRQSIIEYLGKQKRQIKGRIHNLHHFKEIFQGTEIEYWLNDQGKTMKEISPAGFVLIAESEFAARQITSNSDDLLQAVAISYEGTLPPPTAHQITYQLTLPQETPLDLAGGRQHWQTNQLTIHRETLGLKTKNTATCTNLSAFLQPTRFIQTTAPAIQKQAQTIIGHSTKPLQQVQKLTTWVYTTLEKRPVIGLPDALTTLANKRGDCNEHAALFAALARSLGIPTAIATGVTLHNNQFYYHAWNEVCINGHWISVDTTNGQLPADLYHIRLLKGDLAEQLKIGALLGKVQIRIKNYASAQ